MHLNRIASLPPITQYLESIALYFVDYAINYDEELIAKIEHSDSMPITCIRNSISKEVDRKLLLIFDLEIIKTLAKTNPYDFYAKKFIGCDYELSSSVLWFKKAILQLSLKPLARMNVEYKYS